MKKTKRILSLLLSLIMIFSLVACSNNEKPNDEVVTYEATKKGYAGDIKVKVGVKNNEITSIDVDEGEETPTIGGTAISKLTDEILNRNTTNVDVVTGATLSSTALIEAINEALEKGGIKPEDLNEKEYEQEKTDLDQETDIVIVGAGGAGLTAAITAREKGANVIVLEKAGNTGGNTNRATGGMNAAETHYQEEQNIEDTVEQYIEDTIKGGHEKNNEKLVEVLAENSSEAIDWLDSLDANLSDVGLAGGATNKRAHRPVDEDGKILSVGTFLIEKLTKKAEDSGVEIIYNARVDEILMDGDKVSGVTAETKDGKLTVKSKAIVVASGGFGGSDDIVSKYRPELKGYVSTNAPEIEGDAIDFLEKIGANFIDLEEIQTHPTVVQKDGSLISESLRGDGAILLNKEGLRFTDEMQTRDYVSNKINEQTDSTAWLVVNEEMYNESKVVQKYVDQGLLTKADDYKAIAELIDSDESKIEKTISDWASYIKDGVDKEFDHKNLDSVTSDLSKGPYYVGPVGPGIHHTMGGVEINENSEVISKDGNPIKGLYAAGEVTGGVHGGNRLGGNAVTDIVVFGRIAGEEASDYIK